MVGRRDLFKLSLGAALASGATKHKFFTDEEYALVDELTDIIIPTDEKSGGARAAKVADYIDQVLAEAFDSEKRHEWRIQLSLIDLKSSKMHRCAFLKGDLSQRVAVVASMEKEPFFEALKAETVRGYYSSKIGIHDEMDYKGNTYQQGEYAGFCRRMLRFLQIRARGWRWRRGRFEDWWIRRKGRFPCSIFRRWWWIGLACMGSNRSMNIFFRRMRLTWIG